MKFLSLTLAASLATVSMTATVSADGHAAEVLKEREIHMKGLGKNLGVLGDMAKGTTAYDAAAAQAAADALVQLARVDPADLFVEGTDSDSVATSRALPNIWENMDDIVKISNNLETASVAMAAAAGDGLPGIQANIGAIGAACGECHKTYRQPK